MTIKVVKIGINIILHSSFQIILHYLEVVYIVNERHSVRNIRFSTVARITAKFKRHGFVEND